MEKEDRIVDLNLHKQLLRNQGANNLVILCFFATIIFYLGKIISYSLPLMIIVLVCVLIAVYLGNVTAFALVSIISMLTLTTAFSVFRSIYDGAITIEVTVLVFTLILFPVVLIFKKYFVFDHKLGTELLSIFLSISSLFLIWDSRLTLNGGAIAALYASEDNAAWIVNTHRVIQSQGWSGAGDYGSLMDTMLLISHNLSELIFSDLTDVDHLAMSVVLFQSILIVGLPFVSALSRLGISGNFKSESSSFVLSIGLLLGFTTLNSIGHLSAAIAFILISCFLVLGLDPSECRDTRQQFLISYVQILLAYLAGITLFPIAPLSVLLIGYIFWRIKSERSKLTKNYLILVIIFCSSLITLLIKNELLRRFSFFRESGGIASGATSLLGMEGGTISAEPLNMSLLAILATIIAVILSMISQKSSLGLLAFAMLLIYAVSIKFSNAILYGGQINYGARKLELVATLCGSVFLSWALVRIFEIYFHRYVSPVFICIFMLLLFSPMSATNSILGGKYFAGFDSDYNQTLAARISKNIEIGGSAVCINETYQSEPMSELRLAAYSCSRWVSAYSFTDDEAKNEWRKAVLAAVPIETFSEVRDLLPDNTKLLIVAPTTDTSGTTNPEWKYLVSPSWEIIR